MVLGAGASFDASTRYGDAITRPPLVQGLFDPRFDRILDRYPMAKNAAPEIRDALETEVEEPPAVSLEDFLRTRYRDSDDELDQRRFLSITLYLQQVLLSVGNQPEDHFDNLDRLITPLIRTFSHVCFVTLNYDILLDRCLVQFDPLASINNFISHPRWSLIKLHGSVTWGRRIANPNQTDLSDPKSDLIERLEQAGFNKTIYHRWSLDLDTLRAGQDGNSTFPVFPALTVPVGSEDEIVCPEEHELAMGQRLSEAKRVDLLVIGYSGLDTAVIRKLWPARGKVGSLSVVNAGEREAIDVAMRLCPDLGLSVNDPTVRVAAEGFGGWVRRGMPAWLDSLVTEFDA